MLTQSGGCVCFWGLMFNKYLLWSPPCHRRFFWGDMARKALYILLIYCTIPLKYCRCHKVYLLYCVIPTMKKKLHILPASTAEEEKQGFIWLKQANNLATKKWRFISFRAFYWAVCARLCLSFHFLHQLCKIWKYYPSFIDEKKG